MKFLRLLLAATFALAVLPATAQRQPVPIINHNDVLIEQRAGKPRTAAQVKQAIMNAPAPRSWEFSDAAPGVLVGTLHVRGKHTIVAEIRYSADRYSIIYRDSVNMKYSPGGSTGMIHPFYNRWIDELRDAIRAELAKG
jgi:hypothetical protein